MQLILGGTSDTHRYMKDCPKKYIISVATDYGYKLFSSLYGANKVKLVRFDNNLLADFIKQEHITSIVDTTHPFATEITKTAKLICGELGIRYTDRKRFVDIPDECKNYERKYIATDWTDAAGASILKVAKNPLFTIGSKNIHLFTPYLKNAVVRVLNDESSINICLNLGIKRERLIAKRGPFTIEDNISLINKYKVDCLITKLSGVAGGFNEKLSAGIACGINILIVLPQPLP